MSDELSQDEIDKANHIVDIVLDQARIAEEKSASGASWPFREKVPEPCRELLDEYVHLTGQYPTGKSLKDWLASSYDWIELHATRLDVIAAFRRSRSNERNGGFAVTRPGSLTSTIGAVIGERRVGKNTESQLMEKLRNFGIDLE